MTNLQELATQLLQHAELYTRTAKLVGLISKDYWTMDDVALYFNISSRQAHRLTNSLPKGPLPGSRTHVVRRIDVLSMTSKSIKRTEPELLLEEMNKQILNGAT